MEIRGGKRYRTKAERRSIVEETFKSGASVSRVARAHDVNANQVFHWRLQYRKGLLDEKTSNPTTALVPVKVAGVVTGTQRKQSTIIRKSRSVIERERHREIGGSIDIDLGHARVRIEGSADPDCVRAALEGLRR